jgi:hypothetical protein
MADVARALRYVARLKLGISSNGYFLITITLVFAPNKQWLQWLNGGLAMHTSSDDLKCLAQEAGSNEVTLIQDQIIYLGVCTACHKGVLREPTGCVACCAA